MPKSCSVPRCKSNTARNSDLCYHELPAKQQLRDAWLRHISRQGSVKGSHLVPNSRAVVCPIHFKEEDYKVGLKRKVLRPTALPTQFPSYPAYMLPAVSKKRRPVRQNALPGGEKKQNWADCDREIRERGARLQLYSSSDRPRALQTCGKLFRRATPRAFVWLAARPESSEETRASLSPRFPPCVTEPSDESYVAPSGQ
ncbi:hypothetical protein HPB50_028409 [Hyalomma asiaticum]|nr:hypothetical protein HPB50_028409 [Hyalomma asiaticum]